MGYPVTEDCGTEKSGTAARVVRAIRDTVGAVVRAVRVAIVVRAVRVVEHPAAKTTTTLPVNHGTNPSVCPCLAGGPVRICVATAVVFHTRQRLQNFKYH